MKRAFTFIEVVFVIIVLGILAAVLLPRFNDTRIQEAADQLLSHLRYTQHLALVDNKYDPTDANWYRQRYQMVFYHDGSGDGHLIYAIYSDKDGDSNTNPESGEIVTDPYNGHVMTGDSNYGNHDEMLDLTAKFGITKIVDCANNVLQTTTSGGSMHFYFDQVGRPFRMYGTWTMNGEFGDLLTSSCPVTFYGNGGQFTITLEQETGFAHITAIHY